MFDLKGLINCCKDFIQLSCVTHFVTKLHSYLWSGEAQSGVILSGKCI